MNKLLRLAPIVILTIFLAAKNIFAATPNPFGVMTWGSNDSIRVQIASDLGVHYYRPVAIILNNNPLSCTECQAAIDKGFKLILTIRANGGGGKPTTPTSDWNTYKNTLSQVVDKYKPEILVIENEENSSTFYTGTPDQYLAELKVGCELAHQKGIKCTNGGLVSKLVVILVSQSYHPNSGKADDYLKRTLTSSDYNTISPLINSTPGKAQIKKGQDLLVGYKSAGADFVNFHWHQENAQTLPETINYLNLASQGLPVINNEISPQKSTSPSQVTSFMQTMLDLKLPYVIWYSNDGDGTGNTGRALTDKNGILNDSGKAFQKFIKDHFQTIVKIPGDLNNDGKVNFLDFNIIISNFGHPYTIFDYNTLVGNYGK